MADDGSSFDSWNILKNLSTSCRVINPVETVRSLITVKILVGSCDVKVNHKGKPQITNLLCNMNHQKGSLIQLGKTIGLKQAILK